MQPNSPGFQHPGTTRNAGCTPAIPPTSQLSSKLTNNTKTKPIPCTGSVSPQQVNLQEQLQNMFLDPTQSPILLCLGQKGGGKSFRTMTLLMWLIRNNIFDQYFLILPTFYYEASNSYAWLKPFQEKVFIAREYTPEMSAAFLQRKDETIAPHLIPRTFMWLDDVGMNESFRMDRSFVGLLSVARHKRLSICLCYHSLTSGHTLSPFVRQNVTHTLLFRVTNEKLLESIYEELISMTGQFERFKDFKFTYNAHTTSQVNASTGEVQRNFNGICINNSLGCLDWRVAEWFPDESQTLKTFLDAMKDLYANQSLPPANQNQNLTEVTPKIVESLNNTSGGVGKSKHATTLELTPESWTKVTAAAKDPLMFLQNPRHLVQYTRVSAHIPTLHSGHGSRQKILQRPTRPSRR